MIVLALLASEPGAAAESVFDEERVGVEVGGLAALAITGWDGKTHTGSDFGVMLRLRIGAHFSLGAELDAGSQSWEYGGGSGWRLKRQQIGFDLQWRFRPAPILRPWVSVGMAFGKVKIEYEDEFFSDEAHTVDLFRLGLGVDFLVGRYFALGPFLRGSIGTTHLPSIPEHNAGTVPDERSLNAFEAGLRVLVGF